MQIDHIIKSACEVCGVSESEFRQTNKPANVMARAFIAKAIRDTIKKPRVDKRGCRKNSDHENRMTLKGIGEVVGISHSAVLIQIRKLEFYIESEPETRGMWMDFVLKTETVQDLD